MSDRLLSELDRSFINLLKVCIAAQTMGDTKRGDDIQSSQLQDICKTLEGNGPVDESAGVDFGSIDKRRFSILPVEIPREYVKKLEDHFQTSESNSDVYITRRREHRKYTKRSTAPVEFKLAAKVMDAQTGNSASKIPRVKFKMKWFFRSVQERWKDRRLGSGESSRTLYHLHPPHVIRIRHSWPLFQEMRKAYGFMHQPYDAFILFAMVHLKQIWGKAKGKTPQPAPQRSDTVPTGKNRQQGKSKTAQPRKEEGRKKLKRRRRLLKKRSRIEGKPIPSTECFSHPSDGVGGNKQHVNLKPHSSLGEELKIATEPNFIGSLSQLRSLFGLVRCQKCQGCVNIVEEIRKGVCVVVSFQCGSCSHTGKWYSSEMYYGHFVVNLVLIIAYVLSGEPNIDRLSRFLNFMNIGGIQGCYRVIRPIADVIVQAAKNQMRRIRSELLASGKPVVLLGDGRSDSPGTHATKHTYTLMTADTNQIVGQKHLDVREADGRSSNMEIVCARECLTAVQRAGVRVSEFVTDDHSAITTMMKEDQFRAIQFSKDMWHKAKNMSKKLIRESRLKKHKVLVPWIPLIRRHFYFAAQNCEGDPDTMREILHQFLHHIRGEHVWVGGCCTFHPSLLLAKQPTYLSADSSAYEVVEKLLCRKQFVNSLHYYVRNRSTASLESYHNVILKYASKRCYRGQTYEMCVSLATIDHNSHANYKERSEEPVKNRRAFNKFSKKWALLKTSAAKTYDYIPELMAHCIQNTVPAEKTQSDRFVPKHGLGGPNPPTMEQLKASYVQHKLRQKRVYPQIDQAEMRELVEPAPTVLYCDPGGVQRLEGQGHELDRAVEPPFKKQVFERSTDVNKASFGKDDFNEMYQSHQAVANNPEPETQSLLHRGTSMEPPLDTQAPSCPVFTERNVRYLGEAQPVLLGNANMVAPLQNTRTAETIWNHSGFGEVGYDGKGYYHFQREMESEMESADIRQVTNNHAVLPREQCHLSHFNGDQLHMVTIAELQQNTLGAESFVVQSDFKSGNCEFGNHERQQLKLRSEERLRESVDINEKGELVERYDDPSTFKYEHHNHGEENANVTAGRELDKAIETLLQIQTAVNPVFEEVCQESGKNAPERADRVELQTEVQAPPKAQVSQAATNWSLLPELKVHDECAGGKLFATANTLKSIKLPHTQAGHRGIQVSLDLTSEYFEKDGKRLATKVGRGLGDQTRVKYKLHKPVSRVTLPNMQIGHRKLNVSLEFPSEYVF